MCEAGVVSCWSCQSPVAHSCGLLNYPNSFCGGMFELNAKFDADLLLYLLSHFECGGHTVHMLTQQCPLPPLTSTVKSLLFMHAHSSPLSLAARLHRCHANYSCYINNGWTFSEQILYILFSKIKKNVFVNFREFRRGREREREREKNIYVREKHWLVAFHTYPAWGSTSNLGNN